MRARGELNRYLCCLSEADRRVSFTIAGDTQILRSRLDLSAIVRAVMRYELLSNYYRITFLVSIQGISLLMDVLSRNCRSERNLLIFQDSDQFRII